MKNRIVAVAIFLLLMFSIAVAEESPLPKGSQKVFAEKGSIFYSVDGKNKIQLTKGQKDSAPVISLDGKKVVFLRKSNKEAYLAVGAPEDYLQSGPDGILADQVWIVDIDGKNEKMLARDRNPDDDGFDKFNGADVIAHIDDNSLKFSPDSKSVYFISSAWVTSGGLHSVNIDGSNEHFVTAANTLDRILDRGEYKGDLVISQHRYFLGGGSYDWYYVFSPDGKEIGPLGDDLGRVDWEMLSFEGDTEKK